MPEVLVALTIFRIPFFIFLFLFPLAIDTKGIVLCCTRKSLFGSTVRNLGKFYDTAKMTTTRTNLGPLTTPFSYPAHCAVAVRECASCDVFWQAQTCTDNNANGVQDDP